MKTILKFIIVAFAVITTFASCQKENASGNPPTEGPRVLTLSFGPDTKATLEGLQPVFQNGEYVRISNGSYEEEKQISVTDGVATVTTSLSGPLTAVIPSDAAKLDVNKIVGVEIPSYQSGEVSDALICMATCASDATNLPFVCQTALFIVTPPVGVKQFEIRASGKINDASDSNKILVGNGTDTYDKYYVSLLPGVELNDLAFVAGTVEKKIDNPTATAANTAYTITNANWFPVGPLPGKFSVSDGKQVCFSRGNLIATINASGDPTAWMFSTNQYDYIGEGGANTKIGSDIGDIDYFGWSTEATKYGINKSTRYSDYSGDFKDWGTAIDNVGTWRTLTTEEWQYLFNYDSFANTTREGLYACNVTVMGNPYCVILYPDGYTGPKVSNEDTTSYNTAEKWTAAQNAGVVCLPAAGYRINTNIIGCNLHGYYWSSSPSGDNRAYIVEFFLGYYEFVRLGNTDLRCYGNPVRLVTDVPAEAN